jgi:hypothetical protein
LDEPHVQTICASWIISLATLVVASFLEPGQTEARTKYAVRGEARELVDIDGGPIAAPSVAVP